MPLLTITASNDYWDAGNYTVAFDKFEELTTKKGKAYRWVFRDDKGRFLSDLSDAESPPSPRNKTGRWLAALSLQALAAGVSVNPDDYVGKSYFVIVSPKENGGTHIETFAAIKP